MKNNNEDSSTRSCRWFKNSLAMLIIKGLSIVISLFYVPLLLNTLNSVNYGIWLTLTSLVSWCSILDVGIGHGLRNRLSETFAKKDYSLGKSYISTAYMSVFLFVFILMTIFLLISNKYISWSDVLNAEEIENGSLNLLVNIVFVSFSMQFVLGLINSILYAIQMPAISSIITTIGQLLSFIAVCVAVYVGNETNIVVLISIISFVPVLVLLLASVFLFTFKLKVISPSIFAVKLDVVKPVLSLGMKFFLLQISVLFLYQTNNIILTRTLGPGFVTEYNVVFKYISIIFMAFSIIVSPIWSATTDAYTKNDILWIKNTIKKINKIFIACCFCIVIMVLISPVVYEFWIGKNSTDIGFPTTIAMAICVISQMAYGIYGYIINGIGKMRVLITTNVILAILYIPITALLTKTLGITGACLSLTATNIALFIVTKIQCDKLLSHTAKGIWYK